MPLDYPVHERTLPNGLRVVVSPDPSVPNVTLNIWVGVGSRHEATGRTGFAHLFEHLMFQGSRNVASGETCAIFIRPVPVGIASCTLSTPDASTDNERNRRPW